MYHIIHRYVLTTAAAVDVVVVSSGVSRSSSSRSSDLECLAALDAGGVGSDTDTTSDAPTADAIDS